MSETNIRVIRDAEAYVARCRYRGHGAHLVRELLALVDQRNRWLAECYRLAGADPDGDEDWRLAPEAIAAVRELREAYDENLERSIQQIRRRDQEPTR